MKRIPSDPMPSQDPRNKSDREIPGEKSGAGGKDRIRTSDRAGEIERVTQIVRNTPDVRHGIVEALKQAVQSGNYAVPSEKVAEKILDEIRDMQKSPPPGS